MRKNRMPISRRAMLAGAGAVGLTLNLPKGALAAGGKLNFYNWDTYIGEDILGNFTKATGVDVQYDLFADNDELFAKLRNGNPGYDLIVPTNDFVERMIIADMLEPLDHSKLPNMKNVDPAFANPAHDPGRKYTMPYFWGTVGIGYRISKVSKTPDSWADMFTSDEYAGRMAFLGEATTVLQMALKLMGKSMNDWTDENIAAAEAMVLAQKSRITAFAPDNGQDLLLAGEVDLAMEWNGDILQAMDEDDDIGYVVPKEGGLLWEDDLCIPKGAPNPDAAHEMINYLMDAKVAAENADYVYYATPIAAAHEHLGAEYNENTAIFPSKETLANSEVSIYPGQEVISKIDQAWTRIKAAG